MEIYSSTLQKLVEKDLKVKKIFKQEYEGDAKTGSIKIPVRETNPEVKDYNKATGVQLTTPTTTYKQVLLEKDWAINELIDGFTAQSVPDKIKAQRLEAGGYSLALKEEEEAIAALVKKENRTLHAGATALTEQTAYKEILKMLSVQKKKGFKAVDMVIILSPEAELALLSDPNFANTASMLGDDLKQNGVIARIGGANVITSELLPATYEVVIVATPWLQTADAFSVDVKIVDLNNGTHIGASALQGRKVCGSFVTNKDAVLVKRSSADN